MAPIVSDSAHALKSDFLCYGTQRWLQGEDKVIAKVNRVSSFDTTIE
jgi:hypothetical protein